MSLDFFYDHQHRHVTRNAVHVAKLLDHLFDDHGVQVRMGASLREMSDLHEAAHQRAKIFDVTTTLDMKYDLMAFSADIVRVGVEGIRDLYPVAIYDEEDGFVVTTGDDIGVHTVIRAAELANLDGKRVRVTVEVLDD
jgi:hypothetical protein